MNTSSAATPTRQALAEAFELSEEILTQLELADTPLGNLALKTCRLARLLNDTDHQTIMTYEAGGYPHGPEGTPPDVWALGIRAGRGYQERDQKTKALNSYIYTQSISQLEETLKTSTLALSVAHDPNVSYSSANPNQYMVVGSQNRIERDFIRKLITTTSERLASRRSMIYNYALQRHYELKFSGLADDIFTRTRTRVDNQIGSIVPDAVRKLTSVYDNLASENPEDWSNAVHSCRRILQDLADAVFPAADEVRVKVVGGKEQQVKLGQDQYINRLVAYIEDNSSSERFEQIVGSHLKYIGERLESVFQAAQKGSHSTLVSREEADRYVVFTYLLVGDILSLAYKGKPGNLGQ